MEEALRDAEKAGFTIVVRHAGHTWGDVVAPNGQRHRVWSTSKSPDVAAKMIRRFIAHNRES